MRRSFGRLWPIVACRPNTVCAALAFPTFTARVSFVKRCGKYHSVPSTLFMPAPENIVVYRVIGVRAPAPFHPCTGPDAVIPLPRCACAAARLGGEVATLSAYPYWPTFDTRTGGTMLAGNRPEV